MRTAQTRPVVVGHTHKSGLALRVLTGANTHETALARAMRKACQ